MAKFKHLRTWVQLGWTALTNGYAAGFLRGKIYKGPSKAICLPGLNCYSCPGALGACPIGAFQSVLASREYRFAFYVVGFLMFVGALVGRFVCGWLCPFGLVQDLLHKIPLGKKRKKLPGDRWLKYLKYVILAGFVILLPLTILMWWGRDSPGSASISVLPAPCLGVFRCWLPTNRCGRWWAGCLHGRQLF